MAHGPEVRAALRAAYIYEMQGLEAAAQRLDISFASASRWKRESKEAGDDWDKARAAARLAGQGADNVTREVLEDFVILFQSTITQLKTDPDVPALDKAEALSRLSDAYYKTMRATAANNPKLNKLAVAMEVLQLLVKFIRDDHPQHIESLLDVLEGFGAKVTEVFG
jgi:hypothetical protein